MKRIFLLLLSLAFTVSAATLVGCAISTDSSETNSQSESVAEESALDSASEYWTGVHKPTQS